ncbi:MAG TPA: glycoside hydrolase family 2 protein [Opitutaceae bacterium]|nr:glycoside hydrolase family 2 protein [Opitutaceae bacterium]HQL20503.1 glycoside hydrolase family 2 protein [Opitutaceae bacterium]
MHTLPLASARWSFRDATRRSAWRSAVVPGCVHRDLLRHKQLPDLFWGTNEALVQWVGEHEWEYRASFKVTAALLAEEVVDLVADGLDTVATVFLNGHEIARTENMFTGYRWDVRAILHPGKNELRILFGSAPEYIRTHRTGHNPSPEFNDPVGGCTRIRKQQCQFGWDWGPRFITAGIWRDIRLEAWSGNRLANVRVAQTHTADGPVTLDLTPELARAGDVTLAWELSLDGELVHEGEGTRIVVTEPQLWWPNGQGAQPLYELEVVATQDGREIGRWSRRIGLRTIVLDRHADQWGESFQFVVNGRPIFAKGANWIPAHSLPAGLTRADYARDLIAAAQVHMNMVRVWGGGIYESEDFYDLCDELGLLVWQDFMFACTLYPGDAEFQALVRDEAAFQIARLRHRACLALWCGNNEVYGCNAHQIDEASPAWADYQAIFHRVLPEALAAHDGVTSYWPSSPWRGRMGADYDLGAERGDTHYWDVWHSRKPVQEYELRPFRFCSEYGMQSYSSPETQATFCPADDANVFGPTMENHQKNRFGNQIILDYVSRRYRFPKDQDALIYLSQVNQAHCMQVGTEFYRRSTPRCMGALYWQINDCWPVASWSSIEFTGRWKALHHVARRFFAPALVSAQVHGAETTITGNYHRNSVSKVDLYTVYDAPESATGLLRWDLFHLDGRILSGGHQRVALRYGESVCQRTLDLGKLLAQHGYEHVYLRIALDLDGICVSEDTVFLASPRFLALPKAKTKVTLRALSPRQALLTFQSPVFQHRFAFDLPGLAHHATDNWFDLYPGEKKEVLVELDRPATKAQLQKKLRYRSLVDSY